MFYSWTLWKPYYLVALLGAGGQAWSDKSQTIGHGEHETRPFDEFYQSLPLE